MTRAAVLLSGGLDSAVAAAWACAAGHEVVALSVDYGQRHHFELESARRIAAALAVTDHQVVAVDLRALGGSALTAELAVPRDSPSIGDDVPITYVPARNTVLLALLTAYAEVHGASELVLGANVQDYSGYPDCRPEFLRAFARVARLGTRTGASGGRLALHAPLLHLSKAGIVRLGCELGLDLGITLSCYDPPELMVHCGHCDACRLRREGFQVAGVGDPSRYAG
jgi:7-cyano-7-deazaguanine synthase